MYPSLPIAERTRKKEEERLQKAYRELSIQKQRGSYYAESSGTKSSSGNLGPTVVLDDSESEEDAVFLGRVKETKEMEHVDIADNDDDLLDGSQVGENIDFSFRGGVKMEDTVEGSSACSAPGNGGSGLGVRITQDEPHASDEILPMPEYDEETESSSTDEEEFSSYSPGEEESTESKDGDGDSYYRGRDEELISSSSEEESAEEVEEVKEWNEELVSSSSEEESAEEVEEVKEWNEELVSSSSGEESAEEVEEKEILGSKMNKSSKTGDKGKASSKKEIVEEWSGSFLSKKRKRKNTKETDDDRIKFGTANHPICLEEVESDTSGCGTDEEEEMVVLLDRSKKKNKKEDKGESSREKEIDDVTGLEEANNPLCFDQVEFDSSGGGGGDEEDEEMVILLDRSKKKNKKEDKGESSREKEIDDVTGRKLEEANHPDQVEFDPSGGGGGDEKEDEEMVVLLDRCKKKNKKEDKEESRRENEKEIEESRREKEIEESRREKEIQKEIEEEDEEEMVVLLDRMKKMKKKNEKDKEESSREKEIEESSRKKEIEEEMVVLLDRRKKKNKKKDKESSREKEIEKEKEIEEEDEETVVLLNRRKKKNKTEDREKNGREKEIDDGKSKLRETNHPLCSDQVELDPSGGGGADIYEEEEKKEDEEDDQSKEEEEEDHVEEVEKQNEAQLLRGKPIVMKGSRAFKEDEVIKILADSMWHNTVLNFEEETVPVTVQTTLPRKFTFGEEEKIPPKKTEKEIEMDGLWEELAMYRDGVVMDDADIDETEVEKENDAARCSKGCHDFVLEDEMGLVCKFCSHVELESRYCTPPFASSPCGRSSKRDSNMVDPSIFGQLHQQDSVNHSRIGRNAGTVWDIIPGIGEGMHDHQREGFEFLWKNIAGGVDLKKLDDTNSSNGGNGCIISHAPGTGKTRLAIAFILSYMKLYPECRPVIVAPCGMLNAWEDEFRKWSYFEVPFHNLNKSELSGNEDTDAIALLERCKSSTHSADSTRLVKFYSWRKDRSILAISYQLFMEFAGERSDASQKRKRRISAERGEHLKKALLELPGLLVFDEGHIPRNDMSKLCKTFKNIKTGKRIILSGTPFQNNFDELFNTLSLAYPKFLDRVSSSQHGALPKRGSKRSEAKQLWDSLTSKMNETGDGSEKAQKLAAVREVIRPFVHVHKGDILQKKLPGLRDSVVILHSPSLQETVIDAVQQKNMNNFEFEYFMSVVSVHPSLLPKSFPVEGTSIDCSTLESMRLKPDVGSKTRFVMELIRLSMLRNEKVLVFSQYRDSLRLVSDQLRSIFSWIPEKDFLYMDGAVYPDRRKTSIDSFNLDGGAKVMLASTKACCEGINLVGASRVVLLDVVWNPSVERQAISRAYRLGQKKIVHVYHLISSGSNEEGKYWRQSKKDKLSEIVFHSAADDDQCGGSRSIPDQVSADIGSDDRILEEIVRRHGSSWFKEIIYQPKELIVSSLLV